MTAKLSRSAGRVADLAQETFTMATPAAQAVYGAAPDAMGAAALAILVSLLRMLAQKGSLSPDDVEAVLDHAEKVHTGSGTSRRRAAATVISDLRQLLQ